MLTIPPHHALPDDVYDVVATVIDSAGNAANDNTALELTIDTVAPTIPTVDSLVTNDTTPQVSGTALLANGERLIIAFDGIEYDTSSPELSIDIAGNWLLDLSIRSTTDRW